MTAEIAILNRGGIALAADSAVTVSLESNQKIFPSVNKLFTLSKYEPVGVMIYGSATFMSIPWETILKVYREDLGTQGFDHVEDYADHFAGYLEKHRDFFSESVQYEAVEQRILELFIDIRNTMFRDLELRIGNGPVSPQEVIGAFRAALNSMIKPFFKEPKATNTNGEVWGKQERGRGMQGLGSVIAGHIADVFEGLPLEESDRNRLRWLVFFYLDRSIISPRQTGVVIAGFGRKEHFPHLRELQMDGIFFDRLKFRKGRESMIGSEADAQIIPFAQSEMVNSFMQGVDPDFHDYIMSNLESSFREFEGSLREVLERELGREIDDFESVTPEILRKFGQRLEAYQKDRHWSPILQVVASLPKKELAAMAESLVNLTSFKRQVSPESETVGGPIDVAVISKGDGFVWIQRKHYFKPELNHHFFHGYFAANEG